MFFSEFSHQQCGKVYEIEFRPFELMRLEMQKIENLTKTNANIIIFWISCYCYSVYSSRQDLRISKALIIYLPK